MICFQPKTGPHRSRNYHSLGFLPFSSMVWLKKMTTTIHSSIAVPPLPTPSSLLFFLPSSHDFFNPLTLNVCLAHATEMVSQKTANQLFLSKQSPPSLGSHTLKLTTSIKEQHSLRFRGSMSPSPALLSWCRASACSFPPVPVL